MTRTLTSRSRTNVAPEWLLGTRRMPDRSEPASTANSVLQPDIETGMRTPTTQKGTKPAEIHAAPDADVPVVSQSEMEGLHVPHLGEASLTESPAKTRESSLRRRNMNPDMVGCTTPTYESHTLVCKSPWSCTCCSCPSVGCSGPCGTRCRTRRRFGCASDPRTRRRGRCATGHPYQAWP